MTARAGYRVSQQRRPTSYLQPPLLFSCILVTSFWSFRYPFNSIASPSNLNTMSDDTITFGTADSWSYNRITKTYDLTRGSSKKLTIAATQGNADTLFTIDPEKSALVIVDMQNFFLDPKCMAHPLGLKAVEPTIAAIKKCRETGIQVGALYFSRFYLQCVIHLGSMKTNYPPLNY
jgi:hypothetical protein